MYICTSAVGLSLVCICIWRIICISCVCHLYVRTYVALHLFELIGMKASQSFCCRKGNRTYSRCACVCVCCLVLQSMYARSCAIAVFCFSECFSTALSFTFPWGLNRRLLPQPGIASQQRNPSPFSELCTVYSFCLSVLTRCGEHCAHSTHTHTIPS